MARSATGPRYYPSRGGYYAWHRGRQVRLATGPADDWATYRDAWAEFWRVTKSPPVAKLARADRSLVRALVASRIERTLRDRPDRLGDLLALLGITDHDLAEALPWRGRV